MSKLFTYQQVAYNVLDDILDLKGGAILRADEGTGKTHIGVALAKNYDKVLWVTKGSQVSLKAFDAKLKKAGAGKNITLVNYHTFRDYNKLKNISKFDFIIFDESHTIRNWNAGWTQRFVKNVRTKNTHFLFMTATPCIKSPKNYMYAMNKLGLFNDLKTKGGLEEVYKKFLDWDEFRTTEGQKIITYGEELRNVEDFMSRLDSVCYDIKQEDADREIPPAIYENVIVEGEYGEPKDITEQTRHRVDAGQRKAPAVIKHIKENKETGLVLTYFHETAKTIGEGLGIKPALTRKDVIKQFDEFKAGDRDTIITTMGLTSSDFDLNECDWVGVVESTYSAPLDRQSIRRCSRVGKRTTLRVTYFAFNDEKPLIKSLNRSALFDLHYDDTVYRPSAFNIYEKCPGSYWFPKKEVSWVNSHAFFGTQAHSAIERYVNNDRLDISNYLPDYLKDAIIFLRDLKVKSSRHGVESKVNMKDNKKVRGTCDFWGWDEESNILTVADYKNGNSPVSPENNFQLAAYALMISDTYDIKPYKVKFIIIQKEDIKACYETGDIIELTRQRINDMIKRIEAAEERPHEHLNKEKCSFFCAAEGYHEYES